MTHDDKTWAIAAVTAAMHDCDLFELTHDATPAGIRCLAEIASGSLLAYAQSRGLCAHRLLVDMGLSVARGEA